jgi:chromosome segregation ATPase
MKKYFLFLVILTVFFSCNTKNKEIEKLKLQNDSLAVAAGQKDESIINYIRDFNDIQGNLDSIKQAQKIISLNTTSTNGELNQNAKDKIMSDVQLIVNLMQKNKNQIASLSKKLKKSNLRVKELEAMLENLNKEIQEKDIEIGQLKDKLSQLDIQVKNLTASVDTLSTENKIKSQIIEEKTTALNTAYYIIGTYKELSAKNILTKEGGFIGLGKSKTVSRDFNREAFTKIDITKFKSLQINKKKAKMLTVHPSSSYKFEGTGKVDNLVITNYEDFWNSSKYLVILVE